MTETKKYIDALDKYPVFQLIGKIAKKTGIRAFVIGGFGTVFVIW